MYVRSWSNSLSSLSGFSQKYGLLSIQSLNHIINPVIIIIIRKNIAISLTVTKCKSFWFYLTSLPLVKNSPLVFSINLKLEPAHLFFQIIKKNTNSNKNLQKWSKTKSPLSSPFFKAQDRIICVILSHFPPTTPFFSCNCWMWSMSFCATQFKRYTFQSCIFNVSSFYSSKSCQK